MKIKVYVLFVGLLSILEISFGDQRPLKVGHAKLVDVSAFCSGSTSFMRIDCTSNSEERVSKQQAGSIVLEPGSSIGIKLRGEIKLIRCIGPGDHNKGSEFIDLAGSISNLPVGNSKVFDNQAICDNPRVPIFCENNPDTIANFKSATFFFLNPASKAVMVYGASSDQFACVSNNP